MEKIENSVSTKKDKFLKEVPLVKLPKKICKELPCIESFIAAKIIPLNKKIDNANENPTVQNMDEVSTSVSDILKYVNNSFGISTKQDAL